MTNSSAPVIFVLSWQRPLYLWACLDALYRHTTVPCRFVLADNASADPLVGEVIAGFERRDMFYGVHRCAENSPRRVPQLIGDYWEQLDEFFVVVESDTVVADTSPCWLQRMLEHAHADPGLGLLGSIVDKRDFVDSRHARRMFPEVEREELDFLIKAGAPMRRFEAGEERLSNAHNPAGRLLLFRKSAYAQVGYDADAALHSKMLSAGWRSMIAVDVVHRHLSLLNLFDYPEYDRHSRNDFFQRMSDDSD